MKKGIITKAAIFVVALLAGNVAYSQGFYTLCGVDTPFIYSVGYPGHPGSLISCPGTTVPLQGGWANTVHRHTAPGPNSYKWTWTVSGVAHSDTNEFINVIIPSASITYTLTEYQGYHQTDSSSIAYIVVSPNGIKPKADAGFTPQYICPAGCRSCFDTMAILGNATPGAAIPGNRYNWATFRRNKFCSTCATPHGAGEANFIPYPDNDTTKYVLTQVVASTGCFSKDSATVIVGASAQMYGAFPGTGIDGWYAGSYDCNPTNRSTPPSYNVEIWGNTATYGTYNIVVNPPPVYSPNKPGISVKASSSALPTSFPGTLHAIVVHGGVTATINGISLKNIPDMEINAADSLPTVVTLAGINVGSMNLYTPPFWTKPKYPTTVIAKPGTADSFGDITLQGSVTNVKFSAPGGFLAAAFQGVFNMDTGALISIQWGDELKLDSATIQGKKWGGIGIRGRSAAFLEPPDSNVLKNNYPYLGKDTTVSGHTYWKSAIGSYEQGALYATHHSQIINANTARLPAGITMTMGDKEYPSGGGIIIADKGTTFLNSSVYFSQAYNTYIQNSKTYTRYAVSYFHNCTFYNSTVTINSINFDVKDTPTFYKCSFTYPPKDYTDTVNGIISYNSTFWASNNLFYSGHQGYDTLGGITIHDAGLGSELITNNEFYVQGHDAGIYANAANDLNILSKNYFELGPLAATVGRPSTIGATGIWLYN